MRVRTGGLTTPVGRTLIEQGALERGQVSLQSIHWLAEAAPREDARRAGERSVFRLFPGEAGRRCLSSTAKAVKAWH